MQCVLLLPQERERLQEMQMERDKKELQLRAEVRRQNDDYVTQQMLQQRQLRQDQNREIRVSDERRRLEALSLDQQPGSPGSPGSAGPPPALGAGGAHVNNGVGGGGSKGGGPGPGYQQQYMNLPPPPQEKDGLQAPPPPERKSSYNTAAATRNNLDYTSLAFHGQPAPGQPPPPPPPPPPGSLDPPASAAFTASKKSVSFNTDMNTYQDRTPSHSFSSEHNLSPPAHQVAPGPNDVFHTSAPPPPQQAPRPAPSTPPSTTNYVQQDSPMVIGAQEVYRDPRTRIEAQKAAETSGARKQAVERMSFRDKMKYFAQEAGEDTPKYKAKLSRTQRNIESQLNGQ